MKIKTITATTEDEIDAKVNEFEQTHDVKATQTHIMPVIVDEHITWKYVYVLFYNDKPSMKV